MFLIHQCLSWWPWTSHLLASGPDQIPFQNDICIYYSKYYFRSGGYFFFFFNHRFFSTWNNLLLLLQLKKESLKQRWSLLLPAAVSFFFGSMSDSWLALPVRYRIFSFSYLLKIFRADASLPRYLHTFQSVLGGWAASNDAGSGRLSRWRAGWMEPADERSQPWGGNIQPNYWNVLHAAGVHALHITC